MFQSRFKALETGKMISIVDIEKSTFIVKRSPIKQQLLLPQLLLPNQQCIFLESDFKKTFRCAKFRDLCLFSQKLQLPLSLSISRYTCFYSLDGFHWFTGFYKPTRTTYISIVWTYRCISCYCILCQIKFHSSYFDYVIFL